MQDQDPISLVPTPLNEDLYHTKVQLLEAGWNPRFSGVHQPMRPSGEAHVAIRSIVQATTR